MEIVGGAKDFSDTTVLQWWGRYHVRYHEIANLARRRICEQASSATSKGAFSKAGLVLSKKRQRLTTDHVDGISLLGWHYKDNGWGESSKRIRCVPQVEGQRLEEESEMAAPEGFVTRGGVLKIVVVQMRFDPRSSMGLERADALVQALLRPTMDRFAVHI